MQFHVYDMSRFPESLHEPLLVDSEGVSPNVQPRRVSLRLNFFYKTRLKMERWQAVLRFNLVLEICLVQTYFCVLGFMTNDERNVQFEYVRIIDLISYILFIFCIAVFLSFKCFIYLFHILLNCSLIYFVKDRYQYNINVQGMYQLGLVF